MELLERYLHLIKRFLPRTDREDTINELKSLLLENFDSLKDEYPSDDEAMYQVLKDFGNPRDVAQQYRNDQPLISKELEPFMILVMKIVAVTLPFSLTLAMLIEYFNNATDVTTMKVLLELAYSIPNLLTTLFSGLAFVFIIFFILSRYVKPRFDYQVIEFEPKLLPPIPKSVFKVSMFEEVFTVFGSVLFLYLMNLQRGLIAVYYEGERYALLNENFEHVLPFINVSIFLTLSLSIFHLYKRRKNFISSTFAFIFTVYGAIILFFLASRNVFNDILIDGYDLNILPTIFKVAMIISGIASIIGGTVAYVKVIIAND